MANPRLEKSLTELKRMADDLGHWPTIPQWNDYARKSGFYQHQGLYYHLRKSWETMRKEYGYPSPFVRYTKEDCVKALRQASKVYGLSLRRKDYIEWRKDNPNTPSPMQIRTLWGSFTNAKIGADLIPNQYHGKSFSNEEIVDALKQCGAEIGELFSENEYEEWRNSRSEYPSIETIRVRLGSLVEAKRKLGLESYDAGAQSKYDDGRWEVQFLEFLHHSLNIEKYIEWAKENNAPSTKALRDNAGGYVSALEKMLPVYLENTVRKYKK